MQRTPSPAKAEPVGAAGPRHLQKLAAPSAQVLTAAGTNVPTILLVEDEDDSVLLLESAFRKAQFTNPVHRVSHGALAMEYLGNAVSPRKRSVPLPAIVLLDLKLPLVSGLEVLKWIRAHPVLHSTCSK